MGLGVVMIFVIGRVQTVEGLMKILCYYSAMAVINVVTLSVYRHN